MNKQSKKTQKEYFSQKRNTWPMSPVTKVKPSNKVYNRKKKTDMDSETDVS